MKTCIQMLYKSFFDSAFVKNFVKNGQGTGTAIIGFVCLLVTAFYICTVITEIKPVFNKETMRASVSEAMKKLPKIVIKDGVLQWQDGVIEKFVLDKNPRGQNLTVIVDTVNESPTFDMISQGLVYVTKTEIYFYNAQRGEMRAVTLKDLQTLFPGKNPLDLTSVENVEMILSFVDIFIKVGLGFAAFFVFLAIWLKFGILAKIARWLASKLQGSIGTLDYLESKRLAAASTVPVIIIMTALQQFTTIGMFIGWCIVVAGIIAVMIIHSGKKEENLA